MMHGLILYEHLYDSGLFVVHQTLQMTYILGLFFPKLSGVQIPLNMLHMIIMMVQNKVIFAWVQVLLA